MESSFGWKIAKGKDEIMDLTSTFKKCCFEGDLDVAMWLFSFGEIDIHVDEDYPFKVACRTGNLELAKWVFSLGDVDIHMNREYAFRHSCKRGHLDVAKWLISLGGVDIRIERDYAFKINYTRNRPYMLEWIISLYEDTSCLVEYLTTDITTIPLYKNGDAIVILGEVKSTGDIDAMDMYLKDTYHLRKKNYTRKPIQ